MASESISTINTRHSQDFIMVLGINNLKWSYDTACFSLLCVHSTDGCNLLTGHIEYRRTFAVLFAECTICWRLHGTDTVSVLL